MADCELDVELIIAYKHQGQHLLFKVQWSGYDPEHNTWGLVMHLCNSPKVVQAYLTHHLLLSVCFHGLKL